MKRYLMRFSYVGSRYRGSQKHVHDNLSEADSIQAAIEGNLSKLEAKLSNAPKLVMSGRTDAGVHALCTTAHVDLEFASEGVHCRSDDLLRNMNKLLTSGNHCIRLLSFYEVSPKFHARFSAKSRTYYYRFLIPKNPSFAVEPIAELKKSAIINNCKRKFDFVKMRNGVRLFVGTKDFNSFASIKASKDKSMRYKNFVKTLNVSLEEAKPLMPFDPLSEHFSYWNFTFTSKAFLYNQVRRIVGSLFALGFHKITEDDIVNMLQVPSHNNWNSRIQLAPPQGLYLANVEYDEVETQDVSILH